MATSDEKARKNANYRRWYAKNKERLALERAREALGRFPGQRGRPARYRCVEWVDADGLPVAVFASRIGHEPAMPSGVSESSRWLLGGSMSRETAERITRLRCEQVVAWMGGTWPGRLAL
jgi:hypothetical protein